MDRYSWEFVVVLYMAFLIAPKPSSTEIDGSILHKSSVRLVWNLVRTDAEHVKLS